MTTQDTATAQAPTTPAPQQTPAHPTTHAPEPAPRYVDVHILQTLPFSNVNRDDLGSPKTVTFGGTTRTRVSSQAWKRPTRLAVEARIGHKARRTRRLPLQVAKNLVERGWPEELAELAGVQVITSTESKLDLENNDTTASLLFLPDEAAGSLADLAEKHRDKLEKVLGTKAAAKPALPKDAIHEILRSRNGSIALFGRMLAEIPGAGVDGAVQVAHAFTTHSTSVQADFFTAVDDVDQWATDAGSAHMNTGEYSSGVFYRYATLDLLDLTRNVGDPRMARELAEAFLTEFIQSMPSAKKNSTAPHSIPDLVHVVVRSDRPVSLAAAFEQPVQAGRTGWAEPSRAALTTYAARVNTLLGDTGAVYRAHAGVDDTSHESLGGRVASYPALVSRAVAAALPGTGGVAA
ncbi:type I-E CRISPR-associated protein Cas7/Cse4/CasC [Streptomyces sp. SP18CS02]|uniref:type I-E CRISPR-associated protein Cas7/Cse4/CasC n=1 Tax=Streptomyces sp. SP18CS02 TaxID=3002531 RepID=UPI002E771E5C|nr:type I-E CRISPR-associated protein Cas7/Cse4/CasC [Streptomyces sp. SP18CS02]MEE1756494.1 type I-E CRISPR-associated protein Cas7/Cse4/CasC [Streptomyces sp. SP18CS02]